jgi:hypothetical protein
VLAGVVKSSTRAGRRSLLEGAPLAPAEHLKGGSRSPRSVHLVASRSYPSFLCSFPHVAGTIECHFDTQTWRNTYFASFHSPSKFHSDSCSLARLSTYETNFPKNQIAGHRGRRSIEHFKTAKLSLVCYPLFPKWKDRHSPTLIPRAVIVPTPHFRTCSLSSIVTPNMDSMCSENIPLIDLVASVQPNFWFEHQQRGLAEHDIRRLWARHCLDALAPALELPESPDVTGLRPEPAAMPNLQSIPFLQEPFAQSHAMERRRTVRCWPPKSQQPRPC